VIILLTQRLDCLGLANSVSQCFATGRLSPIHSHPSPRIAQPRSLLTPECVIRSLLCSWLISVLLTSTALVKCPPPLQMFDEASSQHLVLTSFSGHLEHKLPRSLIWPLSDSPWDCVLPLLEATTVLQYPRGTHHSVPPSGRIK
jgi:hypothetical protein